MQVHEIFRSIQGEGYLMGTPMTVVRLFGCPMNCWFCDTPQEDYQELSIGEIVAKVEDDWALITGGEPTIHDDLRFLVVALKEIGIKVALETNGTGPIPDGVDWVCVSPKEPQLSRKVLGKADEVKVLVGSSLYEPRDFMGKRVFHVEYSLQPVWGDKYEENLAEAIRLCQKYQVRLSLQMHKYIGVR